MGNQIVLNKSGKGIKKIEGLEKMVNLQELFLQNNSIKRIEGLEYNKKITDINLSKNLIRKIEGVTKLRFLKTLNLNMNKISAIENLKNVELKELLLSHNRICVLTNMEKVSLKKLQYLNLSHNNINLINFDVLCSSFPNLQRIDLSHNRINLINGIQKLPRIRKVNLTNNPIVVGVPNKRDYYSANSFSCEILLDKEIVKGFSILPSVSEYVEIEEKKIEIGDHIFSGKKFHLYNGKWKNSKEVVNVMLKVNPIGLGCFNSEVKKDEIVNSKEFLYHFTFSDLSEVIKSYGVVFPSAESAFGQMKFQTSYKNERVVVFVFESLHQNLHDFLISEKGLSMKNDKKIKILKQITSCVEKLHKKKVVLRKITTENFMIDKKGNLVKLTDFGFFQTIDDKSEWTETPREEKVNINECKYLAPEIFFEKNKRKFSIHSDIYSLGCLFIDIMINKKPYEDIKDIEVLKYIKKQSSLPKCLEEDNTLSKVIKELIKKCMGSFPKRRPTAEMILYFLNNMETIPLRGLSSQEDYSIVSEVNEIMKEFRSKYKLKINRVVKHEESEEKYMDEKVEIKSKQNKEFWRVGKSYDGLLDKSISVTVLEINIFKGDKRDFFQSLKHFLTLENFPELLKIHGIIFKSNETIGIVMDSILSDVATYLEMNDPGRLQKLEIMRKMCLTVHKLHNKGNILSDFCYVIKSEDKSIQLFGVSNVDEKKITPPEMKLENYKTSESSDIFILGTSFTKVIFNKIIHSIQELKNKQNDHDFPSNISEILRMCLDKSPKKRPNTQVILNWLFAVQDTIQFEEKRNVRILQKIDKELQRNMVISKRDSDVAYKLNLIKKVPIIHFEQFKMNKFITNGSRGSSVFKGEWLNTIVAIKTFNVEINEEVIQKIQKEIEIMSSSIHPNICQFLGVSLQFIDIFYIMEWCENGSLETFLINKRLNNHESLTYHLKMRFIKEIACTFNYLHHEDVLYDDLKPSNILLSKDLTCKLIDFGRSIFMSNFNSLRKGNKPIGSLKYWSPEKILGKEKYNLKSDVFSFAMVAYGILRAKFELYDDLKDEGAVCFSVANNPKYRPDVSKLNGVPSFMCDVLSQCWIHDADKRPSFSEIICELNKKFFKKDPVYVYIKRKNTESDKLVDCELLQFTLDHIREQWNILIPEKEHKVTKETKFYIYKKGNDNEDDIYHEIKSDLDVYEKLIDDVIITIK